MVGRDDSSASSPRIRWSSRQRYTLNGELLIRHCFVMISAHFVTRFVDRIAPWVHYVPIQMDLSDLHDTLLFFRGDGNGDNAHEDMARKIAMAGRKWSKKFWRREDLVAYFFRFVSTLLSRVHLALSPDPRLMLEYARVMSLDRGAMSYEESPHYES